MTVYRFEPGPSLTRDLLSSKRRGDHQADVDYCGSGKAAIALILEHLKTKGVLPNKMAPILMPRWLGTWVYAQTLGYGFPTIDAAIKAPVVFVYHQYGFPQDMDKVMTIASERGMVVVEDCAHAVDSMYEEKKLGTFGDYVLFSYSKFAFCLALGGVRAKDPKFSSFVAERAKRGSKLKRMCLNTFKFCDEWHGNLHHPPSSVLFNGFRNMAYSRYGDQLMASNRAIALWEAKRSEEITARRENYRLLRQIGGQYGLCDHLEETGVTPYAVPLLIGSERAKAVVQKLNDENIEAGIYQFDFNRCMFEPAFRPCVLVPIHSGMQGSGMDKMIEVLKSVL